MAALLICSCVRRLLQMNVEKSGSDTTFQPEAKMNCGAGEVTHLHLSADLQRQQHTKQQC
jgi:hypothetical protein